MIPSILSLIWLAAGFVATVTMLRMLGGKPAGDKAKSIKRVHRAFGFVFSIGYVAFLIYMVPRYQGNSPLMPSPFALHAYIGLALLPLLLVKHMIVRGFKKYYVALPYLGVTMFTLATLVVGFTGVHYSLLWLKGPRTTVEVKGGKRQVSIALGRDLLHTKCVACHPLQSTYLYQRTEEEWRSTVKRMQDKQPGLTTDTHADMIVGFLKTTLGPVD